MSHSPRQRFCQQITILEKKGKINDDSKRDKEKGMAKN